MKDPIALLPAAHAAIRGPVVVAVMDGVGLGPRDAGNAWHLAHTPTLDAAMRDLPHCALAAHGPAVGLAGAGDMGNSEVGHNALGSGQIYDQGAKRVAQAVADGSLFAGPVWREVVRHARAPGATLHLIGLLSDGNVHSHLDHALAMVARAHAEGVCRLALHVLLDGRDVGRTSALHYVRQLEDKLAWVNAQGNRHYGVASGGGRMQVTMDRYGADWPMVERGWRCHVEAQGRAFPGLTEAILTLRQEHTAAHAAGAAGLSDQDLPPFVVHGDRAFGPMQDGDAVVLFNFRGDRMLELVDAFSEENFGHFARGRRPQIYLAGMTLYDGDTQRPAHFLVAPPKIRHTLGALLTAAGVRQLACSETQKFGHVTYFWNGNRSEPFDATLERALEVPSQPAPFDGAPAMRAEDIVATVTDALRKSPYGFCRLNLANGDMVGHTGNLAATVLAMEAIDRALATLMRAVVDDLGGALLITADHGNAEDMAERDAKTGALLYDADGQLRPKTSHSTNPVPFIMVLPKGAEHFVLAAPPQAGLANVAASVAMLLGFVPPSLWQPSLVACAPTSAPPCHQNE